MVGGAGEPKTSSACCLRVVCINVSQLLQADPGTVRSVSFIERIHDPEDDLHLVSPIRGRARLTATQQGILVHAEHSARAILPCARCLEDVSVSVNASFDEEFLPMTDVRTGASLPLPEPDQPEQATIDELHEICLDDLLRQSILTSLPFRPLCGTLCPGLCLTCGQRLDEQHKTHPDEPVAPAPTGSPFARLAELLSSGDGNE